jgi:CubicO group peptidase (beta-lactamase class C family)
MRKPLFMPLFLLSIIFCLAPARQPALAQNGQEALTAKVDKLFAAWDKPGSPGAAIAVIKDGAVVYKRGYGAANLEYDVAITPSTVFHVASVSKQFTAFAITLLVAQGKLSLDDDIRKHLPEVADFGKKITIRHLIHHTSGLRDQWELLAMAGWRLDDVITKDHILKLVRQQRELNFEPGAENLYSNTGYTLLAVIVERASGQSFRDFTAEKIFKPLGMSNTHFHDDHQMIVKNRAYSYGPVKDGFQLIALNYANVGATSLFTTAEDLAKWVLNFEEKKVGGAPVIEQMQKKGVLNSGKELDYAFGLGIGPYRGLNTVGHSGGDAGYRSFVFWFPEQRFGVVVLSNLATFNPSRVARQIADIYLADKLAPETTATKSADPVAVKLDPAALDAYAGKYLLDWNMVTVTREGDKLFGQPAGQSKAELIPVSESKFLVKDVGGEVLFKRDENGKVTGFALTQNGQTQMATKAESRPEPNAERLAEFAGNYYSPELGTTYTMVVQNGQLVAQHQRHNDITLTPFDGDRFRGSQWFFQRVQFTRDGEKRVNGFRLSGGRVRNLRFDRQAR